MSSAFSFNGFGLGLLLAAIAAGSAPSALAEIRATGKNGLRTEVNGLHGGACNHGVCRIGATTYPAHPLITNAATQAIHLCS